MDDERNVGGGSAGPAQNGRPLNSLPKTGGFLRGGCERAGRLKACLGGWKRRLTLLAGLVARPLLEDTFWVLASHCGKVPA